MTKQRYSWKIRAYAEERQITDQQAVIDVINRSGSIPGAAAIFQMSDKGLRDWCARHGITWDNRAVAYLKGD